jgi:hypothetical protein
MGSPLLRVLVRRTSRLSVSLPLVLENGRDLSERGNRVPHQRPRTPRLCDRPGRHWLLPPHHTPLDRPRREHSVLGRGRRVRSVGHPPNLRQNPPTHRAKPHRSRPLPNLSLPDRIRISPLSRMRAGAIGWDGSTLLTWMPVSEPEGLIAHSRGQRPRVRHVNNSRPRWGRPALPLQRARTPSGSNANAASTGGVAPGYERPALRAESKHRTEVPCATIIPLRDGRGWTHDRRRSHEPTRPPIHDHPEDRMIVAPVVCPEGHRSWSGIRTVTHTPSTDHRRKRSSVPSRR